MEHLHNAGVATFLRIHKDRPGVQSFLRKEDQIIGTMNKALRTGYRDYLDYLEKNPGDDADMTVTDLEALLGPVFVVGLNEIEKREYSSEEFAVRLNELLRPVYIKDEGEFFTVWGRDGRIDIPLRFLQEFRKFLRDNRIGCEDEFRAGTPR